MTMTRFHNTPLGEFIRMIENKNSDSDILKECVVRLQQLEECVVRLQQLEEHIIEEDTVQAIQCPHCEGNFNVTVYKDDFNFKVEVKK